MVINIGALKSRDYETVFEDICRVVKAAAPAGVKVILETSALDTEQKIIGCTLSKLAGAAFVKTSTGFGKGGATVEDVAADAPDRRRRRSASRRRAACARPRTRSKMAQAGREPASARRRSVAIVTGDRPTARRRATDAVLPVQLIRKKRDGGALDDAEIRAFIAGVTDGTIPDYQVAAMLMAIFFRGLDDRELATWADAMMRSGDVIDLSADRARRRSTSTRPAASATRSRSRSRRRSRRAASRCRWSRGAASATPAARSTSSSRSRGSASTCPVERFAELVDALGVCLIGQTARIAPADKRLYALRDVTATVESLPLIASSIMSKKLAEGIDGLVLDCKVGARRVHEDDRATRARCAALMRAIGQRAGKRVTCVLTDMDAPIGRTIGNALEIRESIEVLRGGGPGRHARADARARRRDAGARRRRGAIAAEGARPDRARARATARALEVFRQVVEAQGGDPRVCDSPGSVLPRAKQRERAGAAAGPRDRDRRARRSASRRCCSARGGARRRTSIDPAAGLVVDAYLGEVIEPGAAPQVVLHHDLAPGDGRVAEARAMIAGAFVIEPADRPAPPVRASRVLEVLREEMS